jgi:hypothetical protein
MDCGIGFLRQGSLDMSRRKVMGARKPCGRLVNLLTETMPPAEIQRLRQAASAGLRDSLWATQVGRLNLVNKLTDSQLATAKRWSAMVSNYTVACQSPPPPVSPPLERGGLGHSPDLESDAGKKLAKAHEAATVAYIQGRDALRNAGPAIEATVRGIVIEDRAPVGMVELGQLRVGLGALADCWARDRRKRSRV